MRNKYDIFCACDPDKGFYIQERMILSYYELMYSPIFCFTDQKSYVLSVRQDNDPQTGDPSVKHYRIKNLDAGGFYISPKKHFDDLFELIEHYKGISIFYY